MKRLHLLALLLGLALLACQSQEQKLAQHLEKAEAFLQEGKWAEASVEFQSALAVDPNSADAHYGLARAFLGGKEPRRAYWELEETVRLAPENSEARLRLGEFLLFGKKEELERALENADTVLAAEPQRWEAMLLKGRALQSLGRVDEACTSFEAAGSAAPADQPVPLLLL